MSPIEAYANMVREVAQEAANRAGRPVHLYRTSPDSFIVLQNPDDGFIKRCRATLVETIKPAINKKKPK